MTTRCESILINIFGGITRCDLVAEGIIDALGRVDVEVADRRASRRHECRRRARNVEGNTSPRRSLPAATMLEAATKSSRSGGRCRSMSIFVNKDTKVVYQGGTGRQGQFHMLRNRAYGTNVVAATNPKKAGENVEGVPVVATVNEAQRHNSAPTCRVCSFRLPVSRARCSKPPKPAWISLSSSPKACRCTTRPSSTTRLCSDFPNTRLLGPELSRSDHAGRVQHRHHSWRDCNARWPGRHRLAFGNAYLPSAVRAFSNKASASPRASVSVATRCPARTSSTASLRSKTTRNQGRHHDR